MLEHTTKQGIQNIINDKMQEKQKCMTLKTELTTIKGQIQTQITEWNTVYSKFQRGETKDVIKKNAFEGRRAKKIDRTYKGHLTHMSTYIGKIEQINGMLGEQIKKIQAHIEELDGSIKTLNTQKDQIPD